MPTRRFQPLKAKDTQTDQAYSEISAVIDALAPLEQYALRTDRRVNAAAGTFMRLAPRTAGMEVSIPRAEAANFGQTITLFVKSSAGILRLRASSGTINGANAITYGAGITAVIVLVSDGESGWASQVALGSLPDIPAGTVIGNPVDGPDPGPPVALTGTQLGRIVQVNTPEVLTLGAGSFPAVVLPDGNTIRLTHGGNIAVVQGIVAPARPGQIIILGSTSGGGDETIFLDEDVAAVAADRIRTPGGVPYSVRSGDYAMMMYVNLNGTTDRWVIFGQPSNLYAQNTQTVAGSGPHDVTLEGGVTRVEFSGSNVIVNSITGGTDTGRLVLLYFSGSGTHAVINQGLGVGNEANIFNPGDVTQFIGPRGSYMIQANGTAGWRGHYPTHGKEAISVSSVAPLQTLTASTTDQTLAILTLPANSVYSGLSFKFFGAMRCGRVATVTAVDMTIRFNVNGTNVHGITAALNVAPNYTGAAWIEGTITFGAPGAACPIIVSGLTVHTIISAVVVTILPTPSIALTVDTTAAITLDVETDQSAAIAATFRTATGGYIMKAN